MDQSVTGLKPGSHLGSYTVLKRLGEGGMALVYLAEHSTLGRLVAIKVLRGEYQGDADAVQRFFLEARAVNQIRHPHIVDITDFCANEGGESYYVMEFLEGMDVEALVTKKAISQLRGLEIARQAASALDAVHDAGIVHRDFKTGNVFVATDADGNDWVKLIDFGLAKLDHPHGRRIGDTLAGIAAGTPEFVSPEQATGKPVDHRSDIYSFGVFLYHVVTGEVPFHGDNTTETIRQHLHQRPRRPRRVKGVTPKVPRALDDLIMQCLAKNPDNRPQSMKEIQPELAMIADSVRYQLSRRSRRLWRAAFVATALAALLVGSGATDWLVGQRPGTSVLRVARAIRQRIPIRATLELIAGPAAPASLPPVAPAAAPASLPAAAPPAATQPALVNPPTAAVAVEEKPNRAGRRATGKRKR